jgi:transcriptional regulator with XRE-family HTH domain
MDNSPFYNELHSKLNAINATRQGPKISFREAVVKGMGFRDSFTSKIKEGFVPTANRLEMLANYLGVSPTIFSVYPKKWAEREIENDNSDFIALIRHIAQFPSGQRNYHIREAIRLSERAQRDLENSFEKIEA